MGKVFISLPARNSHGRVQVGKPNISQSFSRQAHFGKGILGKLSKGEAVALLVLTYGLMGTKAIQTEKSDTLKFF
jgi:hypothetical protein